MTYIWSPSLVERPSDWPSYCEVVGFVNVELTKLAPYTPHKELQDFLDAGMNDSFPMSTLITRSCKASRMQVCVAATEHIRCGGSCQILCILYTILGQLLCLVSVRRRAASQPSHQAGLFVCLRIAGPPPVYIGFGSLVVGDPERLTRYFIDALRATGLRAIIQKGWGGLGAGLDEGNLPEDVLLIGPAPHDFLFEKVRRCTACLYFLFFCILRMGDVLMLIT